ncbi:hypothetical protein Hanom_Chr16g01416681 [Helianthus anomalus]
MDKKEVWMNLLLIFMGGGGWFHFLTLTYNPHYFHFLTYNTLKFYYSFRSLMILIFCFS